MNYNHFHAIAARTETAYSTAQDWIANECPLLEQRLKSAALSSTVNALEFALIVIDWASVQLSKADEYAIRLKLFHVNSKRFAVRQLIKLVQRNQHYKFTATLRRLWDTKGCIAQNILDTIFCLNEEEQRNQSQFSKF